MADDAPSDLQAYLGRIYGPDALRDPVLEKSPPWPTLDQLAPKAELRRPNWRPDSATAPAERGAAEALYGMAKMPYDVGHAGAEGLLNAYYGKPGEAGMNAAELAAMLVPGAKGMPIKRIESPIKVYHGSPHDFDAFDASRIGTGQGAASFGHGLYFAEQPKVAADYRKSLSEGSSRPYMEYVVRTPYGTDLRFNADRSGYTGQGAAEGTGIAPELHHAVNLLYWDGPQKAKSLTTQWLKEAKTGEGVFPGRGEDYYQKLYEYVRQIKKGDISVNKGRTYEAALHADPGEFLNWDLPMSKQSDQIREILRHPVVDVSAERARLAELEAMRPFNDSPAHSRASQEYLTLMDLLGEADPKGSTIYRRIEEQNKGKLVRPIEAERDKLDEHGRWNSWDRIKQAQGQADQLTANSLSEAGIPGVRYWDQKSRSKKTGTSNYVVFPKSSEIIELLKKYGVAAPVAGGILEQAYGDKQ